MRYADDFVIMARYVSGQMEAFVEKVVEKRMGLTINRGKTRVVKLALSGQSLDFLGYTFRYDRDRQGRDWTYLNLLPSRKALEQERRKLRELTRAGRCFLPIKTLIAQVNEQVRGWGAYFSLGYTRHAYHQVNRFAEERLQRAFGTSQSTPLPPPGRDKLVRSTAAARAAKSDAAGADCLAIALQ